MVVSTMVGRSMGIDVAWGDTSKFAKLRTYPTSIRFIPENSNINVYEIIYNVDDDNL